MAEPFLAEIRVVSFNFAPRGWALCNGQTLPINQNQALFSLLGTTYGGNGQTTFLLPNLQSRIPIHFGQGTGLSNYVQGQAGGEAFHTITQSEMPTHTHALPVLDAAGNATVGTSGVLAQAPLGLGNVYAASPNATLGATVGSIGGGQPHENEMPYLVLNFIIALQGIFPSRN